MQYEKYENFETEKKFRLWKYGSTEKKNQFGFAREFCSAIPQRHTGF